MRIIPKDRNTEIAVEIEGIVNNYLKIAVAIILTCSRDNHFHRFRAMGT